MTSVDQRHPTVESSIVLEFDEVEHIRNLFGIDMEVDLLYLDLTDHGVSFVFVFFRSKSEQCFREEIHWTKNCFEANESE